MTFVITFKVIEWKVGRMKYWMFSPSEYLKNYIKHYWIMEIDADEGEVTERVIPTGFMEMMFHYKTPFNVYQQSNQQQQPTSFIGGMSSTFSDVSASNGSGVIAVTFKPEGACHFFKFPLNEIENQIINLNDIYSKEIHLLEDQLLNIPDLHSKIHLIEAFLIKKFREINTHDACLLKNAVQLIRRKNGQIRIKELSHALFTTERTIERKFSVFLGKSPKQYSRIVRFNKTVDDLYALGTKNLTQLAYMNEYADQAHFINEFKSLSGYTPTEFLEKCKIEK